MPEPDASSTEGKPAPGRLGRFTRYLSWTAVGQFLEVGFPPLVLMPLLLKFTGETALGIVLLGLAGAKLIGISPSSGMVNFILRDAAHHDDHDQRSLHRTCFSMVLMMMVPIAALFIFGCRYYAFRNGRLDLLPLIPFFATYLVTLNLLHMILGISRFRRDFRRIAGVYALHAVLLLSAVPLYVAVGIVGVSAGYAIAGILALVYAFWLERETFFQPLSLDRRFVRPALVVWWPIALSNLLYLSAGNLDRLVLGEYREPAAVAVFFAAVSIAQLLQFPAAQASYLMFSMLGKSRSASDFSRTFFLRYLAISVAGSVALALGGWLAGGLIVRYLFADVAEEALPLIPWTVAAGGALGLHLCVRPFVMKFIDPRFLPWMLGAGLVGRVLPLVFLVPLYGAKGAAQAMLIGAAVTGLVWTAVFVWRFIIFEAPDTPNEGGETPAETA